MTLVPQSPYSRALGARIRELHPNLQRYFEAIPEGHLGIGEGEFHQVGTPRRWLWPFLRMLERRGVLVACWETDVPFRITNRTIASRAVGEREFRFSRGTWTMRDAAALKPHGRVVDEIGEPSTFAVSFDLDVDEGALVLTSRAVGVRLGPLRMRIHGRIAPVVRLVERFDEDIDRQRVDLTIDLPLVGRVYEYRGDFAYRIEKESA